jgi:hypothetical protein
MTEQQARALITQVTKEVPEIITRLSRSRQAEDGSSWVVKLQYAGRILTAYKPDEWQSIKWVWGFEDVPEPPALYLVNGIPMALDFYGGYWYGRYQENGITRRKYLGKVDPRPQYQIVEKKEEVTI